MQFYNSFNTSLYRRGSLFGVEFLGRCAVGPFFDKDRHSMCVTRHSPARYNPLWQHESLLFHFRASEAEHKVNRQSKIGTKANYFDSNVHKTYIRKLKDVHKLETVIKVICIHTARNFSEDIRGSCLRSVCVPGAFKVQGSEQFHSV